MQKFHFRAAAGVVLILAAGCASSPKQSNTDSTTSKPATAPSVSAAGGAPTTRPTTMPEYFRRRLRVESLPDKPDDWYQSAEGQQVIDNILGWQNYNGGWYKNYDVTKRRPKNAYIKANDGPDGDDDSVWTQVSTFDNDATHSEIRVMARAYRVLNRPAYRVAFDRALQYILESQYPNGGWPQRYPLQKNYGARITFNDDAMTGVMAVLLDIVQGEPDYTFVTPEQKQRSQAAFDRGLDCILKCQIRVNGQLTAWCQQHDEITFAPAGGRTFELPGLVSDESVDVALLLMKIKNPDDQVKQSIEAAYAWIEKSKILGKRFEFYPDPNGPRGRNRRLVDDPAAPPLWARYYDIQTNQPFFASRDGIARSSVDQISIERRVGYNWYGGWGRELEKAYPKWKAEHSAPAATAP